MRLRTLFCAAVAAILGLSSAAGAQAAVNGQSVKEVLYRDGFFRQLDDGRWLHRSTTGRAILPELQRDEWSVYLEDAGRIVQLDLYTKEYKVREGATIAPIIDSSRQVCQIHDMGRRLDITTTQNLVLTVNNTGTTDEENFTFGRPNFRIDRLKRTYILIHGHKSNPDAFPQDIRDLLLSRPVGENIETANVITLDYSAIDIDSSLLGDFATLEEYDVAYHRAWTVGFKLSELLQEDFCVDPSKVELVANSLGGLVAGATGHDYKKDTGNQLDRIVGLDSVGQYMNFVGDDVRLTKDDARTVIGIHSSDARHFGSCNNQALGWYDAYGDLDIYIYTNRHATAHDDVKQLLGSGPGCYRNDHYHHWSIYRRLLQGGDYSYAPSRTWNEGEMTQTGFNYASLGAVRGSVTLHDTFAPVRANEFTDAGGECAASTFTRTETDANRVEFVLPAALSGAEIVIPRGEAARWAWGRCHRAWWHRQVYRCENGTWQRKQGDANIDNWCHGNTPASEYIRVTDK